MLSAASEEEAQETSNEKYKLKNLQIEDSPITEESFYAPALEDPIVTPESHKIFTDKADRKKIEESGLTLTREVLPFLSPSFFASTQDKKYRNFLKSRGKSVALELDGNLMTNGDASGGGFDNRFSDSLMLNQVESIEVIKDSQTLMYGNTRGSIVHIRTRRPVNENKFSAEIGEYGKQAYTLSIGRDNEKTAYMFNLKTLRYDGPDWHHKFERNKSLFFKLSRLTDKLKYLTEEYSGDDVSIAGFISNSWLGLKQELADEAVVLSENKDDSQKINKIEVKSENVKKKHKKKKNPKSRFWTNYRKKRAKKKTKQQKIFMKL